MATYSMVAQHSDQYLSEYFTKEEVMKSEMQSCMVTMWLVISPAILPASNWSRPRALLGWTERLTDGRYGVLGTTWTKQKPSVVRRSAPFTGNPDIPSRNALREMHRMEMSTVRTTPQGPHPTAPLGKATVEVDMDFEGGHRNGLSCCNMLCWMFFLI